jgi:tetratricopeptide (TPR) repeat protein
MKRPTDQAEKHDWIEQYLFGKMTKEEALFFENELKNDKNLTKEMENIRQTHNRIQEVFLEQNALNTLKKLQAVDRRRNAVFTVFKYAGFAAAACAVFIIYLSFSPTQFPNSENDFTVVRKANPTSMTPQQHYVFNQFFEGQAHIAEGQYTLAIKNLEEVVRFNDLRPYFREAAEWHLAFAYLKSGDTVRAEQLYLRFSNCLDCEYPVSRIDRWKVWWQIQYAKLF